MDGNIISLSRGAMLAFAETVSGKSFEDEAQQGRIFLRDLEYDTTTMNDEEILAAVSIEIDDQAEQEIYSEFFELLDGDLSP